MTADSHRRSTYEQRLRFSDKCRFESCDRHVGGSLGGDIMWDK